MHSFRETALAQLASGARRGSRAPRFESWWPQLFLMDAPFCMGILHGAVQARMARVWGAFCRRGSLVSAGKTFFLMVLARVLALFSLLRPGKQFCDGATPSDVTDSPWIFKPSCFPADACFPLLCFLWRHFFDFLSLATLHGAMADGNAAFDLNVRLEEDDDDGFDLNNGNTSLLLCFALPCLLCFALPS